MAKSALKLPRGAAVIGQSGGPTAVINQSLVGVIEGLRGNKAITHILGARHAVRGIIENDFLDLTKIKQAKLNAIADTPSAALGSSRDKPDADYCKKIFAAFAKRNVRYFFYIGGNDSSDTCRIVSELAKTNNYELRCFHVPKTIDNDLQCNDHTPGFASAAKFVVQAFMGDNLDNASLPGIKINTIMGRHAGFLTAASILARQDKMDGPHLIYVPEVAFNLEKFLKDVEEANAKYSRCLIAVSEGIHDAEGTPMASKLAASVEKDSHGNVQLSGTGALGDFLADAIKKHYAAKGLKARVRADTFGYLQRCFVGCTSAVDAKEARASGRLAAKAALSGATEGSIAIQRAPGKTYKPVYKLIKLSEVAGKTRTLPLEFIVNDNNISDAFTKYLAPLVGKLPSVDRF
jgi:6-phosphofructokinase